MTYVPPSKAAPRPQVPADTYPATLVQIVGMGTADSTYLGETKSKTTVRLGFEIPGYEFPQWTFPMTLSLNEKAKLRAFLSTFVAGVNDTTDLDSLIGKQCLLSFVVSEKNPKYTNIKSALSLPSGFPVPANEKPCERFSYFPDRDGFAGGAWAKLPAFMQDSVRESDEFKASKEEQFGAAAAPVTTDPTAPVAEPF
jgi:hypothetical protein